MTTGRPSKYDPAMCDAVIEAGKEGKTLAEMAAEIGISRMTLNDWRESKPEFSYAVKEGLSHAQAWWEKLMRDGASGVQPDVQPTLAIFNMKNRFRDDWSDRKELDHTSADGSMSPPTVIERVFIDPKNETTDQNS